MRMVLGKSWIDRNSFRLIGGRPDKLTRSSDFLDCNSDGLGTYPDSSETSENGPQRSWKCSRRFQNVPKPFRKVPEWPRMVPKGPGRSWKVPESFGRFHKFPDSTICAPPPLALGGKAPQGGWPKYGGGGALLGEESSLDSHSPVGRTPFGSRSPKGTPTPLRSAKGPSSH